MHVTRATRRRRPSCSSAMCSSTRTAAPHAAQGMARAWDSTTDAEATTTARAGAPPGSKVASFHLSRTSFDVARSRARLSVLDRFVTRTILALLSVGHPSVKSVSLVSSVGRASLATMRSHGPSLFVLSILALAACSSNDDDPKPPPAPTVVASFDAAQGQLPEGIAYRDGAAYVGFARLGTLARVDPATGAVQSFGKLPGPASPTSGFVTGLAFDTQGSLYAALVTMSGDVKPGIYRVGKDGGDATLFAEHADMRFPNGLEFDASGRLWVTDSAKGAVFRVASDGAVALFSGDALLQGQQGYCGPSTDAGFPVGANGLALGPNVVYVTNSDKASLLEIAVNADGSAGAVRTIAGPNCEQLGGADGLVRAPSGSLFVAANRLNKIARVDTNGTIEVRASGAPLDFPASLVISSDNTLWISNFALASANAGTNPKPAVLRLPL